MKNKFSRNVIIGLTFIGSLIMLYFGINFLKGFNVFKKQNQYYAKFNDVSNLLISSPIYVKGYQIGLVNDIKMISSDPMEFAVGLNLTENLPIPSGSYLEYGTDVFGASTATLIIEPSDNYFQPGDTLGGRREMGLMEGVAGVMPKADSIMVRIDSILLSLDRIMSNPMWEKSIEGIASTVDQLNMSSISLNRIVSSVEKDLPEISDNLATVSNDLMNVSSELNKMDLLSTYKSIDETIANLNSLTNKINRDDNSLGLLLNDTKLHDSLNVTIDNAAKLLEDIRENPNRYLSIRLRLF
ncbi:MAG: MCE family protein [Fermentimonas sp.]|nr:MCE family protein [Fermentimonas sp.]